MRKITLAAMAFMVAAPAALPGPSFAQDPNYRYNHREYRGQNRNYYHDCKRSSGTTGAIAGGVGGAVVGNALGGGVLGTLAGAGGGALLGRHLDKKHDAAQNRRNGC